jgi:hypothetical protein
MADAKILSPEILLHIAKCLKLPLQSLIAVIGLLNDGGETVKLVTLLNPRLDEQCPTFQDWLLHQRCRVGLELCEIRARSWRQRVGYTRVKASHFADRLRVVAGKTPKRSSVDEQKLRGVLNLSPRQRRIILALRVAMAAYRPKTYSGSLKLHRKCGRGGNLTCSIRRGEPTVNLVRSSLPSSEQLVLEAVEETTHGVVLRVRQAPAALSSLFQMPLRSSPASFCSLNRLSSQL